MTWREKELLARVYACVNRLGSVGPRNPADIKGLAQANRLVEKSAGQIAFAISSLGFGDLEICAEYLSDAEHVLGVRKR